MTREQIEALKALAEAANFTENLTVDYSEIGALDDRKLIAFLMHGDAESGDFVAVDEDPLGDDAPSPRLEYLATLANAAPDLIAAYEAIEAENKALREALHWYADRGNYAEGPSISENVYCPHYGVLADDGERARKALGAE